MNNIETKINCPICNNISTPYDVVDFNKSCEEIKGKYLSLSLIPIYYYKCQVCNFLFSPELYSWSKEKFSLMIYNDSYIQVDPDYEEIRPHNNAVFLINLFYETKSQIKHLDYGAGNGKCSDTLLKYGFNTLSYDPFIEYKKLIPKSYNLISAFEVFEHHPNPDELIQELDSLLLDEESMIIFSTLLSDGQLKSNSRLDWWYASPRNGHISLYSKKSLSLLVNKYGFNLVSLNSGFHLIFKKSIPKWAHKLYKKNN